MLALLAAFPLVLGVCVAPPERKPPVPIAIPGGEKGVGFDDLQFSRALNRVLVPGGNTGKLLLIDPVTREVEAIEGFSRKAEYGGGHGDGITSVADGAGFLFTVDRTAKVLAVIDPAAKKIVGEAPLAASPDYVRFVAPTAELWVTEPDAEQIEVFELAPDPKAPKPKAVATISVKGGPEALVIDATRGRAYTHLWKGKTVAVDLKSRELVATWDNGCAGSRGLALDEKLGLLFLGCAEGRVFAVDLDHDAAGVPTSLATSAISEGQDIIDYDPSRRHLYVPGGKDGALAILHVTDGKQFELVTTIPTAVGSKMVVTDRAGHVFVGDPKGGRILAIDDE